MYIRTNPILNVLFKPLVLFCEWLGTHFPETLVRIRYFVRFKRFLRLDNPQTLNEKILYLSLRTDTSLWTKCADKYAVREYVHDCGLDDILIPLYGVWEKADEIDFAKLPEKFVMKTTHGSGDIVVVKNKNELNVKRVVNSFNRLLSKPYGALEGGKHYMRIKPKVIVEALLQNDERDERLSSSLVDYKIWCINGIPRYIWACYNRSSKGQDNALFDTCWNDCSYYLVYNDHYRRPTVQLPKPSCLAQMLDVARKISTNIPVLRCDLYAIGNRVYFGEMTFTSNGGMMFNYTEEFQEMLGRETLLPN